MSRPATRPSRRGPTPRHRWAGLVVSVGAVLVAVLGFVTWAVVVLGDAPTTLSGWGSISGANATSGDNINDVIADLDGVGTFRPALMTTLLAGLALIAGLALLVARSRAVAALAAGCGVAIIGWGIFRGLDPGTIGGLVDPTEISAGIGPWLVTAAGVGIVAAAVWVVLDRHPVAVAPPSRRGIQPRR